MPANKNQHFVPKCYLRPFTANADGHAIHLYNIRHDRAVSNAPVKNQCSGDYFYGSDLAIEKGLQQLEGEYARTLTRVLGAGYSLNDTDAETLGSFWLLQHMRTEAASQREVELAAEIDAFVDSDAHRLDIGIKDAVQAAMFRFEQVKFSLMGMKICLVRNRTEVPFVTSDDPAILANKWYALDGRCVLNSHGLSSAGALFILPLSPAILCLMYDSDVYMVSAKSSWIDVRDARDVHSFNQHQYLNCRANIYFQPWDLNPILREQASSLKRHRPATRHKLNAAILISENHEGRTYQQVDLDTAKMSPNVLMHTMSVRPHPISWPRQIALRHGGKAYALGRAGYLRASQVIDPEQPGLQKIRTY